MSVNEKVKKCIKSGETEGERHKGLRKIAPDIKKAADHVQKAIHNLQAMAIFKENGYSDWAIVGCYYAAYHMALALILKKGFSSKNHDATLCILIKEYYNKELSSLDIELLNIFLLR